MEYSVLTINPGSTSTKIGVIRGKDVVLDLNIPYKPEDFPGCNSIKEQMPIREQQIFDYLENAGIDIADIDAVSARGVSVAACEGGTYEINDLMYDHSYNNYIKMEHHPAVYAVAMGKHIADKLGVPAFSVNPMPTDEFIDEARITGVTGIYRPSRLHSLNLKQVAIHHSESMGKKYEESNYVIAHIGGGSSIAAHRKGRQIDGTRSGAGQAPLQPNRIGDFCVEDFREYLKMTGLSAEEGFRKVCSIKAGFLDMLGTDNMLEIKAMIREGNKYAELCYNAMEYGIVKWCGTMAAALKGDVDAVLITGGLANDQDLIQRLKEDLNWIAPVYVYPGSFETEALGMGAIRVLNGTEKAKTYTGVPVFSGFENKCK